MQEPDDSTYDNNKRAHSPATKRRLADSNARHYDLQKQRGKELKEMIPEASLEESKDVQGSNRELMHTLNAAKLYIASLVEDRVQLQVQLGQGHNQFTDSDTSCNDDYKNARGARLLRSQTTRRSGASLRTGDQAMVGNLGGIQASELGNVRGRATGRLPVVKGEDGTLPVTPAPDISPHDLLLRQAVEKFIALNKENVMAGQGVLDKKQINRLNTVHDCIVEAVEDMGKG